MRYEKTTFGELRMADDSLPEGAMPDDTPVYRLIHDVALDVSALTEKLEAIRRLPCAAEHDPTVAEYCNTIFDLATECLALIRGEK